MKRDRRLASLSRDHYQSLVMAQALQRVLPETSRVARDALLSLWEQSGRRHFQLEEEILFPAYARHGDARHPLIARALCDHVEIRWHVDDIARDPRAPVSELQALGARLADHVRMEERELFPLIEATLPEPALADLGEALWRAEQPGRG